MSNVNFTTCACARSSTHTAAPSIAGMDAYDRATDGASTAAAHVATLVAGLEASTAGVPFTRDSLHIALHGVGELVDTAAAEHQRAFDAARGYNEHLADRRREPDTPAAAVDSRDDAPTRGYLPSSRRVLNVSLLHQALYEIEQLTGAHFGTDETTERDLIAAQCAAAKRAAAAAPKHVCSAEADQQRLDRTGAALERLAQHSDSAVIADANAVHDARAELARLDAAVAVTSDVVERIELRLAAIKQFELIFRLVIAAEVRAGL